MTTNTTIDCRWAFAHRHFFHLPFLAEVPDTQLLNIGFYLYLWERMNIEDYREFCLSLGADVEEKLPFAGFKGGDSVLVFYVHGHMFSYLDCDEYTSVGLKCQPERIEELKLQYDCIGTASHMSPKHWIGIDPDCRQDELLRELTRNSYEIVKAKYKA